MDLNIALGGDHAGFEYKKLLIEKLQEKALKLKTSARSLPILLITLILCIRWLKL